MSKNNCKPAVSFVNTYRHFLLFFLIFSVNEKLFMSDIDIQMYLYKRTTFELVYKSTPYIYRTVLAIMYINSDLFDAIVSMMCTHLGQVDETKCGYITLKSKNKHEARVAQSKISHNLYIVYYYVYRNSIFIFFLVPSKCSLKVQTREKISIFLSSVKEFRQIPL